MADESSPPRTVNTTEAAAILGLKSQSRVRQLLNDPSSPVKAVGVGGGKGVPLRLDLDSVMEEARRRGRDLAESPGTRHLEDALAHRSEETELLREALKKQADALAALREAARYEAEAQSLIATANERAAQAAESVANRHKVTG